MIDKIDLTKWKKQKDIIYELHSECGITVTSREWRIAVEKHNKKFANGEIDTYITHSNSQGYKITKDYKDAKIAINDYLKRAFNMIKKAYECKKAFSRKANYQMDFEEGDLK